MRKLSWLPSILIVFLFATEGSADTVFTVTYVTEFGIQCSLNFGNCQPMGWPFLPPPSAAKFSLSSDQLRTPGTHDVSDSYSYSNGWNLFNAPFIAIALVEDEAVIDLFVFFTGVVRPDGPFTQYEGFLAAEGRFWAGKVIPAFDLEQNLFGAYTISEVVPTPESGTIPAAVAALLLLIIKRARSG